MFSTFILAKAKIVVNSSYPQVEFLQRESAGLGADDEIYVKYF